MEPIFQKDMSAISKELEAKLESVTLFGSFVNNPSSARDVDLLLTVSPGEEVDVIQSLSNLSLSLPVGQIDSNVYRDGSAHRKDSTQPLHYHFVVASSKEAGELLKKIAHFGSDDSIRKLASLPASALAAETLAV